MTLFTTFVKNCVRYSRHCGMACGTWSSQWLVWVAFDWAERKCITASHKHKAARTSTTFGHRQSEMLHRLKRKRQLQACGHSAQYGLEPYIHRQENTKEHLHQLEVTDGARNIGAGIPACHSERDPLVGAELTHCGRRAAVGLDQRTAADQRFGNVPQRPRIPHRST